MADIIYTLSDPRNNQVRYVGKTARSLDKRLKEHVSAHARRARSHKNHWLNELILADLLPTIEELEVAEEGGEAEKYWIEYLTFVGANLTNATIGGDGIQRGSKLPQSTRDKMRQAHLGKKLAPFTDQHRANIAAARSTQTFSADTRKKMSVSHRKERPFTDQFGAVYLAIVDASKMLGLNSGNVYRSLKSGGTTGGYNFSYVKDKG